MKVTYGLFLLLLIVAEASKAMGMPRQKKFDLCSPANCRRLFCLDGSEPVTLPDECCPICSESRCDWPVDAGRCNASIPRYFYNLEKQACEKFTYGGCEGNINNFKELETCQNTCVQSEDSIWTE